MNDIDELEMELDAPNDNEWNETRFKQRMDNVAIASANLGALLLQGWTMLADECAQCHTPLMSLRDAAPRCVVCNPVKDASQPETHKKTQPNTQKESKSKLSDINELNTLNDKLWKDDAFEKRIQKSEEASAKIGELLLKGWTMLAEHCGKCQTPLMSLRGGKSMCCICSASGAKKKINVTQPPAAAPQIAQKPKQPLNKAVRQAIVVPQINPRGINDVDRSNEPQHHPAMCFGFGPRQDQQLRRTVGDIVKTVLDKMNAINQRMIRSNRNLRNDLQELNELMEFLQNVKKFKTQLAE